MVNWVMIVVLLSLACKCWCGRPPGEPAARTDTTAEPGTAVPATTPATEAEAEATEAEAVTTEGRRLVDCY